MSDRAVPLEWPYAPLEPQRCGPYLSIAWRVHRQPMGARVPRSFEAGGLLEVGKLATAPDEVVASMWRDMLAGEGVEAHVLGGDLSPSHLGAGG
jgi:hypothetical protein